MTVYLLVILYSTLPPSVFTYDTVQDACLSWVESRMRQRSGVPTVQKVHIDEHGRFLWSKPVDCFSEKLFEEESK